MSCMNFKDFLAWRDRVTSPEVLLACETRLSSACASLVPQIEGTGDVPHRCDLARLWGRLRGLEDVDPGTLLLCHGVREGLSLLFNRFSREERSLGLPRDVYPLYLSMAASAGIEFSLFGTFPDFDLAGIFSFLENSDTEILLLPKPLVLQGRDWSDQEVSLALRWLARSPSRRMMLDAIYCMGLPYGRGTHQLLRTGQVFLLDSLSKGWLHEGVLGVVLVPSSDRPGYFGDFSALPADIERLRVAEALLRTQPAFPLHLGRALETKRAQAIHQLKARGVPLNPVDQGYFLPIQKSAEVLLDRHGVLALPVSVFGSKKPDWSVISALTF